MMTQEISYVGKAKGDTVIFKTLAKAFNVGVWHLHFLGTLIVPYMLTSLPASSSLVPKHGWGNQQGKYHDAFLGGQQPLIIMSSLFVLNPLTPVCWFLDSSYLPMPTATARKRAYFDQFHSAPVAAREAARWFSIHEGGTFGTSDRLLCHSLSIYTQQSAHCHLKGWSSEWQWIRFHEIKVVKKSEKKNISKKTTSPENTNFNKWNMIL